MKSIDMTCSGTRPLQLADSALWRAMCSAIVRLARVIEERRAMRRAARELASMSDRDLRDIGLIRTEIPHAVRRPIIGTLDSI